MKCGSTLQSHIEFSMGVWLIVVWTRVKLLNRVCESLGCFACSSVPGLRPLMDVNYLPLTDMRIARTFCFADLGQAMYLCSPTEIQRITYSQDICENLQAG